LYFWLFNRPLRSGVSLKIYKQRKKSVVLNVHKTFFRNNLSVIQLLSYCCDQDTTTKRLRQFMKSSDSNVLYLALLSDNNVLYLALLSDKNVLYLALLSDNNVLYLALLSTSSCFCPGRTALHTLGSWALYVSGYQHFLPVSVSSRLSSGLCLAQQDVRHLLHRLRELPATASRMC
jgi:hypothetical protein